MDALVNGFALLFNGLLSMADWLVDWKVLAAVATAASLLWMARLEIDETDVKGAKPYLPRG